MDRGGRRFFQHCADVRSVFHWCLSKTTAVHTEIHAVVERAEQPSRVPHVHVQKDTETSSPGQLTACTRIERQQIRRAAARWRCNIVATC